jgi:hypothetical protein
MTNVFHYICVFQPTKSCCLDLVHFLQSLSASQNSLQQELIILGNIVVLCRRDGMLFLSLLYHNPVT